MKRQHLLVLIGSTLAFSWLAMQAVHELGHVVGAMLSGGRVDQVILHPATISQTRLAANPHPQFVAWMGPILGVALPVAGLFGLVTIPAGLWLWHGLGRHFGLGRGGHVDSADAYVMLTMAALVVVLELVISHLP
jgi:hypothetical protein